VPLLLALILVCVECEDLDFATTGYFAEKINQIKPVIIGFE